MTKIPKSRITVNKTTLKKWWAAYRLIEDDYWENIKELEQKMAKDTGVKDIEIFFVEGEAVGIGNGKRTMKLIEGEKLE